MLLSGRGQAMMAGGDLPRKRFVVRVRILLAAAPDASLVRGVGLAAAGFEPALELPPTA